MKKILLSLACSALFALAIPASGPPPVPAGFNI